jgi:integrase
MRKADKDVLKAQPGRHHWNEQGLYLYVTPDQQVRRWIFRFTSPVTRKVTETGLGLFPAVTSDDAKVKVLDIRRQIAAGICPINARRTANAGRMSARLAQTSFGECCNTWIETHKSGWRSASHLRGAKNLLLKHGEPLLVVPVVSITSNQVQVALTNLWAKHPIQARRVLSMWERVFDYAKAKGMFVGDNPASWRGCHEYRWPKQRSTDHKHFVALPYGQIPEFMKLLRQKQGRSIAASCLEYVILTACRSGEALGARWSEINWDSRVWTIPKERTKQGRQHQIPLSTRAMELLVRQKAVSNGSELVFSGYGKQFSGKAMSWVVKDLGFQVTVHGFRSSFRDFCGDTTEFAREHVESCLGHQVGNGTELAYRRSTALEKRRVIMEAWSEYCHVDR